MRLHCNGCGSEGRFSVIRETTQVVEVDSDMGNEEVINDTEETVGYYMCRECESEDVDDLDEKESNNG